MPPVESRRQPAEILDFWFADGMARRWFRSTPALDDEIRRRFEDLWRAAADGQLDHWSDTADGALALVIVLDQLPLNMFRDRPEAFATEARAIAVSRQAVERGHDRQLAAAEAFDFEAYDTTFAADARVDLSDFALSECAYPDYRRWLAGLQDTMLAAQRVADQRRRRGDEPAATGLGPGSASAGGIASSDAPAAPARASTSGSHWPSSDRAVRSRCDAAARSSSSANRRATTSCSSGWTD